MNMFPLVGSLDLCRRIPEGEFANSELCWVFDTQLAQKDLPETDRDAKFFLLRGRDYAQTVCQAEDWGDNPPCYPAPSIIEIFRELTFYERQIAVRRRGGWTDAALRLWLRGKSAKSAKSAKSDPSEAR